jgi:hypothetical protein
MKTVAPSTTMNWHIPIFSTATEGFIVGKASRAGRVSTLGAVSRNSFFKFKSEVSHLFSITHSQSRLIFVLNIVEPP